MNLLEERLKWKYEAAPTNKMTDGIVQHLMGAEADPVVVMAVDMVLRPFLQWVSSAERMRCDPDKTRNSAVMLFSSMILELSARLKIKDDEGVIQPQALWINEFVESVIDELEEDMKAIMRHQQGSPPPPGGLPS